MQNKPIPNHITSQGLSDTFLTRFYSRVNITDSCWPWTGHIMPNGYGTIPKGRRRASGGRCMLAHRASWIIHFGAIPDGLFVCHECDTKHCVNPAHLWVGTHQQNMDDMLRKGREAHNLGMFAGEKHYGAKLTWNIAAKIRSEYTPYRVTLEFLSNKYGVSRSVISGILANRIWVDSAWKPRIGSAHKLSDIQMREIQTRYEGNKSKTPLSKEFGVSESTIYNIARIYHKY